MSKHRYIEQSCLGDGGMPGKERNEINGVEIRDVVAQDHGRTDIPDFRIDLPMLTGNQKPAESEKTPIKPTVQSLEDSGPLFREEKSEQIERGEENDESRSEISPYEKRDGKILHPPGVVQPGG